MPPSLPSMESLCDVFYNESKCIDYLIEGTWNGVKLSIQPRQRTLEIAPRCFEEIIWRRKNKANLWEGFINALRDVKYGQ
jgi:hypothetical protein